ncbi:MAG: class A beta-lactamase-related serine hydrolase [Oligoflexia bacterium]|nr:class A beta-lactamase-related serine hydrolase [Oligoflexia bacterium]
MGSFRCRRLVSWLLPLSLSLPSSAKVSSLDELRSRIAKLDQATPGELGVYLGRLESTSEGSLAHDATRPRYLSSTTKVPIAIVLLQKVEQGELSLEQELVLRSSDYVDGAGETIWLKPGARLEVKTLLERMLVQSDSTATDMLIRLIGEEELNRHLRARIAPSGFGRITSLLDVRKEVYAEFHPNARELDNLDFIELKRAGPARALGLLAAKLRVSPGELRLRTLQEGYERYYLKGKNSADLVSYGRMLERLAAGELLNAENTRWMLGLMQRAVTGELRIKAGLRPGWSFAQKTGTQRGRMCNMGILSDSQGAFAVIAACVEKFEIPALAEKALARLGEVVSRSGFLLRDQS